MLKKVIYFVLSLVLLLVVAGVSLVVFVDPNNFKPLITEEVKKATGRDLSIAGDIAWQFWPNLGIAIESVALSNPTGFAEENLLQFDKAQLSVALFPLLTKSAEIKLVRLHGARIFMQTLEDGSTNIDGLTASSDAAPQTPSESTEPAQAATWKVMIGEVDIQNASALIRDDKTNTLSEIDNLDIVIGQFVPEQWVPVSFAIKGKQNTLNFSLEGQTQAKLAKMVKASMLKELSLNAKLEDSAQGLEIDALSLSADQLGLSIDSQLALIIKGKAQDLSIDSSSKLTINIDELMENINIKSVELAANLTGESLPNQAMKISLNGDLLFDNKQQRINAENILLAANDITVSGAANVQLADIPKVRFDFKSEEINLDTFIGINQQSENAAQTEQKEQTSPTEKSPLSDVEPDLSALNKLDIAGKIAIDKFIASNVKVTDVVTEFAVNRGKAELKQFDAALYEGSISASSSLDATQTPVRFSVQKSIKNVQIQPLLMDAAKQNMLAGKGNIEINLQGVGLSELNMRKGLTGTVSTSLVDGAVYGINIPQILREAKAALKGEQSTEGQTERKTDFSAFVADFALADGVASTTNMSLQAPAIRIQNQGSTNILDQSMNFTLLASVVETSKGQGSEDLAELKGITVPVSIGGTWQSPSYGLDLKALLSSNKVIENKLREEAEKGLNKLFGDKPDDDPLKKATGDLLNKLFN